MKVGDLVKMKDPSSSNHSVGIVVQEPDPRKRFLRRAGVLWSHSQCVEMEPEKWLEVVNENR